MECTQNWRRHISIWKLSLLLSQQQFAYIRSRQIITATLSDKVHPANVSLFGRLASWLASELMVQYHQCRCRSIYRSSVCVRGGRGHRINEACPGLIDISLRQASKHMHVWTDWLAGPLTLDHLLAFRLYQLSSTCLLACSLCTWPFDWCLANSPFFPSSCCSSITASGNKTRCVPVVVVFVIAQRVRRRATNWLEANCDEWDI